MPEAFDAYFKWLGIEPEDQPPTHYRLLGIKLLQSDPDVIANAADKQMAHIRSFQAGPHSALSQKILNEIAAARICLLNTAKKAEYDEQLRNQLAALESQPQQAGLFDPSAIGIDLAAPKPPPVASQPRQSHRTKLPWQLPATIGLGLLAVVAIFGYLIATKPPEGEKPGTQAKATTPLTKDDESALTKPREEEPFKSKLPTRTSQLSRVATRPDPKPETRPPKPEIQPDPKPNADFPASKTMANIVEGVGWGAFRVGASLEDLAKAFGSPDAGSDNHWVRWNLRHHIDCLVDEGRGVSEIRFNVGFELPLTTGIRIGSLEDRVLSSYGKPEHVTVTSKNSKRLEYSGRGLLFNLLGGRVIQIVVFRPKLPQ